MEIELAGAQHGLVTRVQLRLSGLSDHMIDGLIGRGSLVPLHRGVFRVVGAPTTWRQSVLAACLAAGPAAVASHRAAAVLWELEGIEEVVEVTVPGTRLPRLHGIRLHRTSALQRADVATVDRIPVTRVPRTLVDLASVVPHAHLGVALDDALSRGLMTPAYLRRRLLVTGTQGRRGAAALLQLLEARPEGRALAHRAFERLLFDLLDGSGLPRPTPQFPVLLPGGKTAYIDYAYPAHLVGLEADSYRYHSSRTQWSRDHTRNAALIALGWRILPVTYDDVVRYGGRTLALVRQALSIEACRVTHPAAG